MPPDKNLSVGQMLSSQSQAGEFQPSFVLNWKHMENIKFPQNSLIYNSLLILTLNWKEFEQVGREWHKNRELRPWENIGM